MTRTRLPPPPLLVAACHCARSSSGSKPSSCASMAACEARLEAHRDRQAVQELRMLEAVLLEFPRFANGQLARHVAVDDVFVLDVVTVHMPSLAQRIIRGGCDNR
jgi:hypothetical protein